MAAGIGVHLGSSLAPGKPATGQTLVLLHGAGMDHHAWEPQLAALGARGMRAFAPDFPGHGLSGGSALADVTALASWILQVTEALGLEQWALAGHSMGALVALETAIRAEGRVTSLALIGAALKMPVNPELMTAAREDLPRAAALIARWGYGASAQADGRAEIGRQQLLSSPPGVLAADLSACSTYEGASTAASRIVCPVVVVAGAEDRMTPAKRGRALAEALPGAEFVEIAESGHMLMAEAPDAVTDVLVRIAEMKEPGGCAAPGSCY